MLVWCGASRSSNFTNVPLDTGHDRWSQSLALNRLNTIAVSHLLGEATTDTSVAVGKARAYYSSCMNTTAIDERGEGEGGSGKQIGLEGREVKIGGGNDIYCVIAANWRMLQCNFYSCQYGTYTCDRCVATGW